MSSTGQKWLVGCGIGCGVVVVVVAALLATGAYFVKDMVSGFEAAGEVSDELDRRFGEVRDFCPPAENVLTADRIEVFLAVRNGMEEARREMGESLGRLAEVATDGPDSAGEIFGAVKSGLGLLPGLARYYTARNQALLAEGMGKGEYLYLYDVIYYGWLDKSPEDGPPFVLFSDDDTGRDDDDLEEWEVREQRSDRIRQRGRADLLPMLRCQLEALDGTATVDPAWRAALVDELGAVEAGTLRIPWIHGLPDAARAVLEPYRARLEESYSAVCNPVEAAAT